MEEEFTEKTEKKQRKRGAPPQYLFKPGQSGNPAGRPKGSKNFETYFMEAWKEVAEALRLNKDPDKGKIEILKIGFKEMFKGNYQFWRDFIERLFGKVEQSFEVKFDDMVSEINIILKADDNKLGNQQEHNNGISEKSAGISQQKTQDNS